MMTRDAVETAYCFFHQKECVYSHSTMDWQKDDIEYAISSYVETMNGELYRKLSGGKSDFLCSHASFGQDLRRAVAELERMMDSYSK